MGLQLIFVVETNKDCKSDWIYIKETIDHFFAYDATQIKLSTVYLDGKWKYKNKEKAINSLISKYKSCSKNNESIVLFCVDCDEYDCKQDDKKFLSDVQKYCDVNEYKFVWFCRDIKHVYLKERVEEHQKKRKSAAFSMHKKIRSINVQLMRMI